VQGQPWKKEMVALGVLVIVLSALMAARPAGPAAAQQSTCDPAQGGKRYVENCAVCHGVDGKGRVGASLDSFPGIQAGTALHQTIAQGIPGSVMPAWSQAAGGPLDVQAIDDIVCYVTGAFGGTEPLQPLPTYVAPTIEPLPNVEGNPSAGAVVFQENCVVCHGAQGEGRFGYTLARTWSADDPAGYLRQVVGQGISGSAMPAWALARGGPLSDQQIADVAAFVLSLPPLAPASPTPAAGEGPLGRGVSLALLGGLAVLLLAALVVYYRRA
jgi:mono/diheme cytochrome c family protein